MSRLLLGQFSAAAALALSATRLARPSSSTRAAMLQLTDDLQVISGGNPLAIPYFGLLAREVARPIRDQLKRDLAKATLRQSRRKSSA